MTDFFSVLSVSSFILSIGTAFCVARIAIRVRELQDRLARSPISRIEYLEGFTESLTDEVKNLANRVKMIKVRRAADHVRDDAPKSELPDPYKNPDEWRAAMNSKLSRAKISA